MTSNCSTFLPVDTRGMILYKGEKNAYFLYLNYLYHLKMVLKNFIHYIINKYLKNYVERLDYENLKFNLKNG